ncbi:MAG: rhomboid family intramembrane serine protease [Chthoniobacterales bacterium]
MLAQTCQTFGATGGIVELPQARLYGDLNMTFLDSLERRCGWIAIPGLIRIVVALTALVYLLTFINPDFISLIALSPARIRDGEVWRLITYIFIPRSMGAPGSLMQPLWLLVALWFLLFIGDRLEQAWGAFRLTLYFLVGMIGTTIAAFLFGAQFSNTMLASSLFFAYATFYPDEVIYLFFVLPVKVKWLAWISAGLLLFGFASSPNSYRIALIVAFANYLIFFGPDLVRNVRNRQQVTGRRKRFEEDARPEDEALHHCATCGATELTNANLEFRVSRDGEEYCLPHLPSATKVEV